MSEDFILRNWAIETLVKKVRYGAKLFAMSQGGLLSAFAGIANDNNNDANVEQWGDDLSTEDTVHLFES